MSLLATLNPNGSSLYDPTGAAYVVGPGTAHAAVSDADDLTFVRGAARYIGHFNADTAAWTFTLSTATIAAGTTVTDLWVRSSSRISPMGVGYPAGLVMSVYTTSVSHASNTINLILPLSMGSALTNLTSTVSWSIGTFPLTQAQVDALALDTLNYVGGSYQETDIDIAELALDIYVATIPTPTSVLPATSTITTSKPLLQASFTAPQGASGGNYARLRRHWQTASNSGFTTSVTDYYDAAYSSPTTSTNGTFQVTTRLPQGTWYLRCRLEDPTGASVGVGSWSSTNTLTIAHVPTTTAHVPAAGNTIQYSTTPTVSWAFSDIDTTDAQTKFQVQLWKTSAPGTLLDSGLITSATGSYTFLTGIDATWKDTELRWHVLVQDGDAVSSGYSIDKIFFMSDLPVVAVTNPAAAAVITTSAPLVTWTTGLTAGRTQAQFKVDIIRASVVQSSSGWITSAALLWQVPAPVVTVGPTHQVTVTVIDSVGLVGTSTNSFTATYAAPTTPVWTIDQTQFPTKGYYSLDWTSANVDANFFAWRVYRRVVGTTTWILLFQTGNVGTRLYKDYLAASNSNYEYAVVQVSYQFSAYTESVYPVLTAFGILQKYMLLCPSNETLNMSFEGVEADAFGLEIEQATTKYIGFGRRSETGTSYGHKGSLTARFRDNYVTGITARAQRLSFEGLQATRAVIYLKKPFGDTYKVALMTGNVSLTAGSGLHEYGSIQVDYEELA